MTDRQDKCWDMPRFVRPTNSNRPPQNELYESPSVGAVDTPPGYLGNNSVSSDALVAGAIDISEVLSQVRKLIGSDPSDSMGPTHDSGYEYSAVSDGYYVNQHESLGNWEYERETEYNQSYAMSPESPSGASDEVPRLNLIEALNIQSDGDIKRIITVRKCHKLGFRSHVFLRQYFSKFGSVEKVVLLPMRAKPKQRGAFDAAYDYGRNTRPSSMGFVVMSSEAAVRKILSSFEMDGGIHVIKGWPIEVNLIMSAVDLESLCRRVSRQSRGIQLRSVFLSWRQRVRSTKQKEVLAGKLARMNHSKYLWELLSAWHRVCFQPCPFGAHFVHVDRGAHADRVDDFLLRSGIRHAEHLKRVCLLGWKVVMVQRVSRLAKQTEICAGMIDRRERDSLGLHFYNWFRLLDDVRMGRAARRIQEDTKRLAELKSKYEREFSTSDRLMELYVGSVRETEKRSLVAMAFYHWYVRGTACRNVRLQLLHPKENRKPNLPPAILSFQEFSMYHEEPDELSVPPVEIPVPKPPLQDPPKIREIPLKEPDPPKRTKPGKQDAPDPPKKPMVKLATPPTPAAPAGSPSSSSSSSGSSSISSTPSTIAAPSLFKVSLPFFMRMRSKVRDWAMRAREAVAKRHQMAAIEQAVELAVNAWRPSGVPTELFSQMTVSEALKIFKEGATLKKRKGGVSKVGVRDTFGSLKDQTRFFVGQVESAEKFLVYFKNVSEARNGAPPNGAFSLEHLKNAQFSWELKEFGAVTDKMNDDEKDVKKVSHIPDKFFAALVISIRHALASQTRRTATASFMNLATNNK